MEVALCTSSYTLSTFGGIQTYVYEKFNKQIRLPSVYAKYLPMTDALILLLMVNIRKAKDVDGQMVKLPVKSNRVSE